MNVDLWFPVFIPYINKGYSINLNYETIEPDVSLFFEAMFWDTNVIAKPHGSKKERHHPFPNVTKELQRRATKITINFQTHKVSVNTS